MSTTGAKVVNPEDVLVNSLIVQEQEDAVLSEPAEFRFQNKREQSRSRLQHQKGKFYDGASSYKDEYIRYEVGEHDKSGVVHRGEQRRTHFVLGRRHQPWHTTAKDSFRGYGIDRKKVGIDMRALRSRRLGNVSRSILGDAQDDKKFPERGQFGGDHNGRGEDGRVADTQHFDLSRSHFSTKHGEVGQDMQYWQKKFLDPRDAIVPAKKGYVTGKKEGECSEGDSVGRHDHPAPRSHYHESLAHQAERMNHENIQNIGYEGCRQSGTAMKTEMLQSHISVKDPVTVEQFRTVASDSYCGLKDDTDMEERKKEERQRWRACKSKGDVYKPILDSLSTQRADYQSHVLSQSEAAGHIKTYIMDSSDVYFGGKEQDKLTYATEHEDSFVRFDCQKGKSGKPRGQKARLGTQRQFQQSVDIRQRDGDGVTSSEFKDAYGPHPVDAEERQRILQSYSDARKYLQACHFNVHTLGAEKGAGSTYSRDFVGHDRGDDAYSAPRQVDVRLFAEGDESGQSIDNSTYQQHYVDLTGDNIEQKKRQEELDLEKRKAERSRIHHRNDGLSEQANFGNVFQAKTNAQEQRKRLLCWYDDRQLWRKTETEASFTEEPFQKVWMKRPIDVAVLEGTHLRGYDERGEHLQHKFVVKRQTS